MTAEFNVS